MKLTIHSSGNRKEFTKDMESGILNQAHINVYNDQDLKGLLSIDTNCKITDVQKCIEYCEELGDDKMIVAFDLSFDDAIILGKHLVAMGEQAIKSSGLKNLEWNS